MIVEGKAQLHLEVSGMTGIKEGALCVAHRFKM